MAASAKSIGAKHQVDAHGGHVPLADLLDAASQCARARILRIFAEDIETAILHAAVARDVAAADVVVQYGFDLLVFLLRPRGVATAAGQALLSSPARAEAQRHIHLG